MSQNENYLTGFGNYHESEAIAGLLPKGRNSPQKISNGIYAEQINGSAFTMSRESNLRSWFYRTMPSIATSNYENVEFNNFKTPPFSDAVVSPEQVRWFPEKDDSTAKDFLSSIVTYAGHGSGESCNGGSVHLFSASKSMGNQYLYNADGDFLIVPYQGTLEIKTEMGTINLEPCEIAVIPRGIRFQANPSNGTAKGYINENYGSPFILPNLGPIGANGLANPRDFLYPQAKFYDEDGDFEVVTKYAGKFFKSHMNYHPLNVVAWHGNYAPYKYDLRKFNTINTVSYDHPDPSIFTVLTSPSAVPGLANIDFVIFPERWMVAEDTFRPPYYHRNLMSEFMGLIKGVYDAKPDSFSPGGATIHNRFSAHGPAASVFETATHEDLKPIKQENTLAFMFESHNLWQITSSAYKADNRDENYLKCWDGFQKAIL